MHVIKTDVIDGMKVGKMDKVVKTLILFLSGGANYAYQITTCPTPSRFSTALHTGQIDFNTNFNLQDF